MKANLRGLVVQAIHSLRDAGTLPADAAVPDFVIERPRDRSHGDFSTNAAMLLVKLANQAGARTNPRALAQALVAALPASELVAGTEIAGPGFINFRLTAGAWREQLRLVHAQGGAYGRNDSGGGRVAGVEYVSANPTGPLHVGHGRAAVIGDCISRVLDANGWKVKREFYYNDAGVQIDNLARSVQARANGLTPDDAGWPEDGYRGDYIADVARAFLDGATVEVEGQAVTAGGDAADIDDIRRFAVAYLRNEQNQDLAAFGVSFDVYFLESSLYADGKVEQTVRRLVEAGHAYEEGGALWLRTTDFGDDKDRVMRKSDGTYTYFVPDVAYHLGKWERGYERAITELGADHHGSLARVKAGLQALDAGIPQGYPEYVLHQMVTVMRGGEEVKLSKRAGSYLTLRDLIEEAGRDATRWFLVARNPNSQLVFDIDLARSQSLDNPVYYVQLSHARICGLLRQLDERGLSFDLDDGLAQEQDVDNPAARELLDAISRWPETVQAAGDQLEPHLVTTYLLELAQSFQTYYNDHQFLVDDARVRNARLAMALATRQVLANGLELVGVAAPGEDVVQMAVKKGRSQARRNSGNSGGLPGWAWMVLGIVITLVVVLAAPRLLRPDGEDGFYRPRANPDATPAPATGPADEDAPLPAPVAPAATSDPDYDFYTLLPGQEVPMTDAELEASAQAERERERREARQREQDAAQLAGAGADALPAPTADAGASAPAATAPAAAPADSTARYLLQAGSFSASGDAEALKARIALLGLGARVESAQVSGRTVYRVRMGPYGTASELADAKGKLERGGLEPLAIKMQ